MHGEFCLRRLKDGECGCRAMEVKQATTVGRDMLVVAGAEAEEVAELVIASTEALRRGQAFEAAHASRSAFDAAVVLLQPVVLVRAGTMDDPSAERIARG